MFSLLSDDFISLNRYRLHMLNGVPHYSEDHPRPTTYSYGTCSNSIGSSSGRICYHIELCHAEYTRVLSEQVRCCTLL